MNLRGLSQLCCPVCKGTLSVVSFQEERTKITLTQSKVVIEDRDAVERVIKEGALLCQQCQVWYPIASYVPVMLVFRTPFHDNFVRKHQKELIKITGYNLPQGEDKPGERSIQETFTEEWDSTKDNELTFTYTKDELKLLHKKVWLKWPEAPPANVRQILDIGCGLGVETEVLHEISDGAETFGVDLNFSLLHKGGVFKQNPLVHLCIASLFNLPFRVKSFDLVYSEGVLHHTYSTYDAFKTIATLVKEDGQIFIWVYALEDRLVKGFIARLGYLAEGIIRPILSRVPAILRYVVISILSLMLHPLVLMKVRQRKNWRLRNTNHNLCDLLTPRYAHRHSFNEVIEWFESLGFTYDLQSPAAYQKLFAKRLWGIGVIGHRASRINHLV